MKDISKGRFWDKPWSLVDGCTPCSPGCDHCWSAAMTHRFGKKSVLNPYVSEFTSPTGRFIGHIKTHPERHSIPLKRRKPTVYACWNDLFHEAVSFQFQLEAWLTMERSPQHKFLVLTKRPDKMAYFFGLLHRRAAGLSGIHVLSNLYHGLTVCNQQEADEKIPVFLQVPGKKFLSIEPMLGEIDFKRECFCPVSSPVKIERHLIGCPADNKWGIEAVILGGETGPGARPMQIEWVRSVRDQCQSAGVPFFFKGWGAWIPIEEMGTVSYEKNKTHSRIIDMETHNDLPWRELL